MEIEIFEDNWTIDLVRENTDKLFVFGDNNLRIGKVGQAIIRDLPNTKGLRTKKGPSDKPIAFYTDVEFEQNIINIREDILEIKKESMSGKKIVFSRGGYGTGTAQLEKLAPRTYFKFCQLLLGHFGFDNVGGTIRRRIPGYDEIMAGRYISLDNKQFESNVLTPVNNSFFKEEYLSQNLNTLYDLVKLGKKVAFTYPVNHNLGEIVIFSVKTSKKYLVCRVLDSYDWTEVDKETWSFFEAFNSDYVNSINFTNSNQKLYQNHFEFICTLDEEGKMEFNTKLFGNQTVKKPEDPKVVGQTISSPEEVIIPDGLKKILKKKKLEGEITKFPGIETFKFYKKEKYQIKIDEDYYAVEYLMYPFWNSVNILLTSKNPFL